MTLPRTVRRLLVVAALLGVLIGTVTLTQSLGRARTRDRLMARGTRFVAVVRPPRFGGADAVGGGWRCDHANVTTGKNAKDAYYANTYVSAKAGVLHKNDEVQAVTDGHDVFLVDLDCRNPLQQPVTGVAILLLGVLAGGVWIATRRARQKTAS